MAKKNCTPKKWTENELDLLRKMYASASWDELEKVLGHPRKSISSKASSIGLSRPIMPAPITLEEIREMTLQLMEDMNTRGYLPNSEEFRSIGITPYRLRAFGGIRKLSKLLGIPMLPARVRREDLPSTDKNDIRTMEQVRPSKAFEIQMESGKRWADIQREETLEAFGRVDISQFDGLQTYAERMAAHG